VKKELDEGKEDQLRERLLAHLRSNRSKKTGGS